MTAPVAVQTSTTRRALTCTGYRWAPAEQASACGAADDSTKRSGGATPPRAGCACTTPPSSCGSTATRMPSRWPRCGPLAAMGPGSSPKGRWGHRPGVAPDSSATRFGAGVTAPSRTRRRRWTALGESAADSSQANQVLRLVESFPTATWGRDEQRAGDMWNSNSLTAWLLALSGHDVNSTALQPPTGGAAPGWSAGLVVAARARAGQACSSEGCCDGWTDQSGGSSLPASSSCSASAAVACTLPAAWWVGA